MNRRIDSVKGCLFRSRWISADLGPFSFVHWQKHRTQNQHRRAAIRFDVIRNFRLAISFRQAIRHVRALSRIMSRSYDTQCVCYRCVTLIVLEFCLPGGISVVEFIYRGWEVSSLKRGTINENGCRRCCISCSHTRGSHS